MSRLPYTIAVILVILWLVGYFGFNAGRLIHILIIIAVITILLRVIAGNRLG
jgi:predicted ferric reductase